MVLVNFWLLHAQALFNSLPPEDYKNGLLVLGGDGRYFNKEASQVIFCSYRSGMNFFIFRLLGYTIPLSLTTKVGFGLQIIIKIAAGNGVGKILVGK